METLSSTEACLFGREAGDKEKERAWGAMGKGSGDFSLFPSPLARFLFFDHCYFYWDTQREPLRRREPWKRSRKNCLHDGSMVTTLVVICNTRFCHFHPFFFTKHAKGSKIHNFISCLLWLNTFFLELLLISPYPERYATNKLLKIISWTIEQPIELTITRFPVFSAPIWLTKLSPNSMKKPTRKTRALFFFFRYSARTCSLPYLVVLLNVTQLWVVRLVNPSYNNKGGTEK